VRFIRNSDRSVYHTVDVTKWEPRRK